MKANCTDGGVDLTGTYGFPFTPLCDSETDETCTTFMDTMDNSSALVLSVYVSYSDSCDDSVTFADFGDVVFSRTLSFYAGDSWGFLKRVPYVIGEDTIYGQIDADFTSNSFVDLSIDAVYVCTVRNVSKGCLSSEVEDGPYTIINNDDGSRSYQGHSFYITDDDVARFSFRAFGMLICDLCLDLCTLKCIIALISM